MVSTSSWMSVEDTGVRENFLMAKAIRRIDISNLPEVLRLAEQVKATRAPRLLTSGDRPIAVLTPVEPAARSDPNRRRRRTTGPDDPLWNIIGIGDSAGSPDDPTDVSENKHRYLADAYNPPR
jgi:hypothetical protein